MKGTIIKRGKKVKLILAAVAAIFLVVTMIRGQRLCVVTYRPTFFYETKTEDGASFDSIFSETSVKVVRKGNAGTVTITQGEKEYQYLVETLGSVGKISVYVTDLQADSVEVYQCTYNLITHGLMSKTVEFNDKMVEFNENWPEDFDRENIIQLGLLDTSSAIAYDTSSFGDAIILFVVGFLILIFCRKLATISCYVADLFYHIERPIKPRQWTIVVFGVYGGINMIIGIGILSTYLL